MIAIARQSMADCVLCGQCFWPWSEIEIVGGILLHRYCKADWIAGQRRHIPLPTPK